MEYLDNLVCGVHIVQYVSYKQNFNMILIKIKKNMVCYVELNWGPPEIDVAVQ